MNIFLDLDGVFVDLYNVNNWLDKIRNFDTSPYEEAKKLQSNHILIEKELIRLQKNGNKIIILSALPKVSNTQYDIEVMNSKISWINNNFKIKFDEINIIPYDSPKELYSKYKEDILIDDNKSIRENWHGIAFDEKSILENLKKI